MKHVTRTDGKITGVCNHPVYINKDGKQILISEPVEENDRELVAFLAKSIGEVQPDPIEKLARFLRANPDVQKLLS